MRLRIAAGLSLLVTLPAGTSGRGRRQAVGADAGRPPRGQAHGRGRPGARRGHPRLVRQGPGRQDNVINGANPKVEGLETAWAIEAPEAKTAAVVTSDGKTLPLTRIGDTPVFAATFPLAHGSAFRWTYVTDGNNERQEGPGRSLHRPARARREARRAQGQADPAEALGEQDLPQDQARLVGLRPRAVQGRPARLRHGLSGRRRLHGLRAHRLRQPDRQGRDARDRRRVHQPRHGGDGGAASAASSTTRCPTDTPGSCSRRSCPRSRRR